MTQGAFKGMQSKLLKGKKDNRKPHKSNTSVNYNLDKKIAPKKLGLIKQNTLTKVPSQIIYFS